MTIFIECEEGNESSLPTYNEEIICGEHPTAIPDRGYGLAGGGIGPYTTCSICNKMLSKSLEEVDEKVEGVEVDDEEDDEEDEST